MLPDMLYSDVNPEALKFLEENETPESRRLEYKEELPLDSKSQRLEFCADVSAFANADGGYLLVGVKDEKKEDNSKPRIVGIPEPENTADYITRLENIVNSGVEPNVNGINIDAVGLDANNQSKIVLVIFIPPSYSMPHWVGTKRSRSFWSRNSNGKYPLDINEVRQMFLFSETVTERIREFRYTRIEAIKEGLLPMQLNQGPKVVLHVVPFSAVSANKQLNLSELTHKLDKKGRYRLYSDFSHCFDGLFQGWSTGKGPTCNLVFRNGSLEFVCTIPATHEGEIFVPWIDDTICENFLPPTLEWYDILKVSPPMFYMLSVLNVRNQKMTMRIRGGFVHAGSRDSSEIRPISDKDHLLATEVHVDSYERDSAKLMRILRPALDAVWQASGWPHAKGYAEDGNWVGLKHLS